MLCAKAHLGFYPLLQRDPFAAASTHKPCCICTSWSGEEWNRVEWSEVLQTLPIWSTILFSFQSVCSPLSQYFSIGNFSFSSVASSIFQMCPLLFPICDLFSLPIVGLYHNETQQLQLHSPTTFNCYTTIQQLHLNTTLYNNTTTIQQLQHHTTIALHLPLHRNTTIAPLHIVQNLPTSPHTTNVAPHMPLHTPPYHHCTPNKSITAASPCTCTYTTTAAHISYSNYTSTPPLQEQHLHTHQFAPPYNTKHHLHTIVVPPYTSTTTTAPPH